MNNYFKDAPTVGSDDINADLFLLRAKVSEQEQQIAKLGQQQQSYQEQWNQTTDHQRPKKGIRWGKFRKIFATVIAPILVFIPQLINAICRYKEVAHA